MITLVLVLRHSIEKRSNTEYIWLCSHVLCFTPLTYTLIYCARAEDTRGRFVLERKPLSFQSSGIPLEALVNCSALSLGYLWCTLRVITLCDTINCNGGCVTSSPFVMVIFVNAELHFLSFVVVIAILEVDGARFIGVLSSFSKSRYAILKNLAEKLASRNNEICKTL